MRILFALFFTVFSAASFAASDCALESKDGGKAFCSFLLQGLVSERFFDLELGVGYRTENNQPEVARCSFSYVVEDGTHIVGRLSFDPVTCELTDFSSSSVSSYANK